MPFITIIDYLLLPFYIVIIFLIAYNFREKNYPPGHPWRPYFIAGLLTKISGSIGIGLIYQYYYGGGDTANYFEHVKIINSALNESVVKWFNLITHSADFNDGDYFTYYTSKMYWYESPTEYTVAVVAAWLGLLTFSTFLPISVLFGTIAFTGLWALFRTFATKYPTFVRQIAACTMFIPSTVMWGSGLFKDTLCMFAVGWLTYGVFRMLLLAEFSIGNILITVFSFMIIAQIKMYILLAFVPAMLLWILFTYSHRIKDRSMRTAVKLGVVAICAGGFVIFSSKFSEELGKYSLDKIGDTAAKTSEFIAMISGDEGSAYSLGTIDPSPAGMLKILPAAINVTLFRPYIWETRKPLQLVNAIEASMLMFVTFKVFFTLGWKKVRKAIGEDPTIQFTLIFTLIFAFAVGMSSGNFGTLSRYRIPCLPFFGITLCLIYYRYHPSTSNIFAFKLRA
jgi:hypothetical protein